MHYAYSSATPLFLYSKADGSNANFGPDWTPSSRKISTDSARFFGTCERNAHSPPAEYLSYTGPVKDESGSVVSDLRPIEAFYVGRDASRNSVNVWMGCQGVTTHTHYDVSHNLYVQLYGRKRFVLFPPGAASAVYLFPKSHPSHRSSQVPDFLNVSLGNFPRMKQCLAPSPELPNNTSRLACTVSTDARALCGADALTEGDRRAVVVDLGPGDVLYLPPFWFHRVTALTTSISVNVWSDADAEMWVSVV